MSEFQAYKHEKRPAVNSVAFLGNRVKGGRYTMQNNHTPIPTPEQETYVSKCSKELKAALQEIYELQQWLLEAKAALPQKVIDQLMAAPTRDEADTLS